MRLRIYRVGLLVLLLLLLIHISVPTVLDVAEKSSPYAELLENDYRFGDKIDKTAFEAFLFHIKYSDGYKVVFIGDSVVAGSTTSEPSFTIPAHFKRLAGEAFPDDRIRVYNLGIPGNRPSDIYFLYKKIKSSSEADLIIMNINYAFFSDKMLKETLVSRPDLYSDVMDEESAEQLGIDFSAAETFIRVNIAGKWNLYSMREELAFLMFGRNPRELLTEFRPRVLAEDAQQQTGEAEENEDYKNWKARRPFPEDRLTHWTEVFNTGRMDSANKGFWFLERLLNEAGNDGANAAVFLTPVNMDMVREYDLLRLGQNYNENMYTIESHVRNSGFPLFDYTNSVDTDYFHDLFHMGPDGNRRVAELLLEDLRDNISKGLGR